MGDLLQPATGGQQRCFVIVYAISGVGIYLLELQLVITKQKVEKKETATVSSHLFSYSISCKACSSSAVEPAITEPRLRSASVFDSIVVLQSYLMFRY